MLVPLIGELTIKLIFLEWYIRDLKLGSVASDKEPVITQESPATALVDGNNLLGPVVGSFCMKLAIKKAKEVGIGLVCCNRSNHYGIAGFYSMQALEENLIVKISIAKFKYKKSKKILTSIFMKIRA